uniref:Helicase ATP-binding domain-containing protein n=1 Tax=Panagrolaimus superbus TaxID=310955 RepID=A0A914YX81_9BILA
MTDLFNQSFESDSSDSIIIDESIAENFPRLPRRKANSSLPRRANAQQRKINPSFLNGTGSSQDPVILLPSQNESVTSNIADNSDKSDSDVTLDEEDDVMESEEEEMSENSFIVDDEEEEEDMILTQQPTIQSDSDESFACDDESIVIDESIISERRPLRSSRPSRRGTGRNQNPIIISDFEENVPCSSTAFKRKRSSPADQSCIIIEDSEDEKYVGKASAGSSSRIGLTFNYRKVNPISTNSSMPEIIELDSFINDEKRIYGGKMTDKRKDKIAAVTVEVIKQIHGSLDSMPENVVTETPEDLTVDLMLHQKHGLTWMKWRENQKLNRGGILADDMGLGKTLSMISLIVSQKFDRKNNAEIKEKLDADMKKHFSSEKNIYPGYCTLVVAPASVIYQWEKEIKDRVKFGKLKVYIFHGPKREKNPNLLARNDIVITTYNTISSELGEDKLQKSDDSDDNDFIDDKWYSKKNQKSKKVISKYNTKSVLAQIGWERIILDEAHNIKNRKSLMSKGCCQLHAFKRWALTGTPIHNELWDFYSLIKFLRISPFSDQGYWKMHMSDMSGKVARERLNTLVKSILLRRTKKQICSITKQPLVNLKPRTFEIIEIKLEGVEEKCYQQMMEASQQRVTELINQQSQNQQNSHRHHHRNKETTVVIFK